MEWCAGGMWKTWDFYATVSVIIGLGQGIYCAFSLINVTKHGACQCAPRTLSPPHADSHELGGNGHETLTEMQDGTDKKRGCADAKLVLIEFELSTFIHVLCLDACIKPSGNIFVNFTQKNAIAQSVPLGKMLKISHHGVTISLWMVTAPDEQVAPHLCRQRVNVWIGERDKESVDLNSTLNTTEIQPKPINYSYDVNSFIKRKGGFFWREKAIKLFGTKDQSLAKSETWPAAWIPTIAVP